MKVFQSFLEVRQQVTLRWFPVEGRIKAGLRDLEQCEVVLRGLYSFWREVSCPIYWEEVVEYQIAVLKFQVRLQKSSHIRMIHQHSADGRLLLDLAVLFDYRFSPASIDYREEIAKVRECFGRVPKDFYKREGRTIIPMIVYDNNRVLVERERISCIEAVPEGLVEINELLQ